MKETVVCTNEGINHILFQQFQFFGNTELRSFTVVIYKRNRNDFRIHFQYVVYCGKNVA